MFQEAAAARANEVQPDARDRPAPFAGGPLGSPIPRRGRDASGWGPFQLVLAPVLEDQSGSRDEVLHGRGDEDLGRSGQRPDARAHVDGDAPDVVSSSTISPVWHPARISSPRGLTASTIERAHRTALAGPSNIARNPSPVRPSVDT